MNNSVRVNADDTLNVMRTYIEEKYGYENTTAQATVHKGYFDYRDCEPDRVEVTVKANKDLGLGLGISEISIALNEDEMSAIIIKKLMDQGISVQHITFEKTENGYYDRGDLSFTGTKISLKTLDEFKKPKEFIR